MDYLTSLVTPGRPRKGDSGASSKKPSNPLTYPQSSKAFNHGLFKSPTSEYRGCPFWAWNNKLDEGQLLRQIDNFADMGFGGFHMHVRTGLDTEYMGDEYMKIARSCVEYAESRNMLACLYDDDRWPSGAAGGKVMKDNPEHKGKHILFTPRKYGTVDLGGAPTPSTARASRSENGYLLASYSIGLDGNGRLNSYKRLRNGETGGNVWYAYVETNLNSSWFNGQTYVDTLSHEAMAKFIEITHEKYKDKLGDKFGTAVPCIFTDEPQFATKTQLGNPRALDDVFLPWTTDLPESFKKECSANLIDTLPELFWDLPEDKHSLTRYQFHNHVCDRFVTAFMDQIAGWCKKNNLMLNGHMMEEPNLWSQTTALGEAMRCYRSMEMPGMDLLADRVEYNTAKQVSSVGRQNGHRGAMSEIYGATHWTLSFEAHKGCGDWQAVLGITFRVPHLTWVSMAGESKRDYPACIGYQSPWYKEYPYIEDHFARVAVAMTRGKAVTRVAVIHPIESFWLCFGPNGSSDEMGRRNGAFDELTNWLLHGLIDFDFISESLLPSQVSGKVGKKLQVGACAYDVVILPNLRTIRSSTLKILRLFTKAGGKVLIAGSAPNLVDAQSVSLSTRIEDQNHVYWGQQSILSALESHRDIRVINDGNQPTDRLLYQMREDGDERFVFICNTDRGSGANTTVHLKGNWAIEKLDTFTGNHLHLQSSHEFGWTSFPYQFEGTGSLLIRLSPTKPFSCPIPLPINNTPQTQFTSDLRLDKWSLTEPNVLMLDYAEYKLDNACSWSPRTEVLRIENLIRSELQLPPKGGATKQPYSIPYSERSPKANVTLRFTFTSFAGSDGYDDDLMLALEDAASTVVHLNEVHIPTHNCKSWWVDESITTVSLPPKILKADENILTLTFPFGVLTNIERVYLLGDMAVKRYGKHLAIFGRLLPDRFNWGDITDQMMPFYVGNVNYHCSFSVPSHATTKKQKVTLSVPNFSAPLLTVHNNQGEKLGRIAFQPRSLDLGLFEPGEHKITITAFGNRYNAFGHVHLEDGRTNDCWPDLWRTSGDWWTDEYRVKPIGVLTCPTITISTIAATDPPLASPSITEVVDAASASGSENWVVV